MQSGRGVRLRNRININKQTSAIRQMTSVHVPMYARQPIR